MSDIVLVIDDDPFVLATLRDVLGTEETEPVLATGADALHEMRRGLAPDVIVIDFDMREAAGILAQLDCAMEGIVPVVALSSRPRRLLEAGMADAVVMKPFEVDRLRRCVRGICRQPRGAL